MENIDLLSNDLQLSPQAQSYLTECAKWGKFLAIMGFILCGIMVLVSFLIPAIITSIPPYNTMSSQLGPGLKVGMTVLYLCFSVLFFFPAFYLYKFSSKMQIAVKGISQENFDESLMNLKSMFKFYGIFTIILLSFYALVFIFGIVAAAMH
ncbi:MAG: DUF5362 family protein [Ginsengibacter sp.]